MQGAGLSLWRLRNGASSNVCSGQNISIRRGKEIHEITSSSGPKNALVILFFPQSIFFCKQGYSPKV